MQDDNRLAFHRRQTAAVLDLFEHGQATHGRVGHVRQVLNVVLENPPHQHAGNGKAIFPAQQGNIHHHYPVLLQFLQNMLAQGCSTSMEPPDGGDEVVLDGCETDIILALALRVGQQPGDFAVVGGKAFNGQLFKLPVIGDLAEKQANAPGN